MVGGRWYKVLRSNERAAAARDNEVDQPYNVRKTRCIGVQWVVWNPDALRHPVVGVPDDGRGSKASKLPRLLCGFRDERILCILDPLLLATVGLAATPSLLVRHSRLVLVWRHRK